MRIFVAVMLLLTSASSGWAYTGLMSPEVEVNCIKQDDSCEVIRLADDRRATLPSSEVLTYLATELRLPSKSKLKLVAMEDNFLKLKLRLEGAGYRIVTSVSIGLKRKEA